MKTKYLIVETIIYLGVIVLISSLTYQQAYFTGMKDLCKNGTLVENFRTEEITCSYNYEKPTWNFPTYKPVGLYKELNDNGSLNDEILTYEEIGING